MKQVRIISSVLSLIALLLCAWPIIELTTEGADLIAASLNLIYFFTLLIALLCFRISLGYSTRINPVSTILSFAVIVLSTYTWLFSSELLITGKITLALIPILLGTTLLLIVKGNAKWNKLLFPLIGCTSLALAVCVFIGVSSTYVYTLVFIGLIISSIAVVANLIFARSN